MNAPQIGEHDLKLESEACRLQSTSPFLPLFVCQVAAFMRLELPSPFVVLVVVPLVGTIQAK